MKIKIPNSSQEPLINSEYTKCGKDMAECQRCTIWEWLFMSRTTKFFIVRLECLAYYGKCFSSCRGLFGNLCPFVEVLISGTNPYFIGLYWPIKVCPLRSMIWMVWTTWQPLHYLEKLINSAFTKCCKDMTFKLLQRAVGGPLPPYGGVYFWDNQIIHRIILML